MNFCGVHVKVDDLDEGTWTCRAQPCKSKASWLTSWGNGACSWPPAARSACCGSQQVGKDCRASFLSCIAGRRRGCCCHCTAALGPIPCNPGRASAFRAPGLGQNHLPGDASVQAASVLAEQRWQGNGSIQKWQKRSASVIRVAKTSAGAFCAIFYSGMGEDRDMKKCPSGQSAKS